MTLTLKMSQFDNLDYAVFLENPLSRTTIIEPNRIKIIEFLKDGAVFQIPSKLCAAGHQLVFYILPRHSEETLTELKAARSSTELMYFTAKVKNIEQRKGSDDQITVDFQQIDRSSWNAFVHRWTLRQKRLTQLIKGIRDE